MKIHVSLFIVFGISVSKATWMHVCPSEWSVHESKCYWFSAESASRSEAKSACESQNSTLVISKTHAINTFLHQHISRLDNITLNYWIGLTLPNKQGHAWKYSSGLRLISAQINWCDNYFPNTACPVVFYPNGNQEPCLKTYTCSQLRPFICEKEYPDTTPCPDGWDKTKYESDVKCYFVSMVKKSNTEAARYCWRNGARLVSVPHVIADNYIKEKEPKPKDVFWVGLSPYKWDDGTPYNWHNWDDIDPIINMECVRLMPDERWISGRCNEILNFICQKNATFAEVTTASTMDTTLEGITTLEKASQTRSTVTIETQTQMTTVTIQNEKQTQSAEEDNLTGDSSEEDLKIGYHEHTILVNLLIGLYSVVGVTAIVFICLLVKYISLKRRSRQNNEKHINSMIGANNFNDEKEYPLYDSPENVYIEDQETKPATARPTSA